MSIVNFVIQHWDGIVATAGLVATALGIKKKVDTGKLKRAKEYAQVLEFGVRSAKRVATLLRRKAIKGSEAVEVWRRMVDEMCDVAGIAPPDAAIAEATHAALRFFEEHVLKAPLGEKLDDIDEALSRFERAWDDSVKRVREQTGKLKKAAKAAGASP